RIRDVLQEDQPEDDVLILRSVHVITQCIGRGPELGLEPKVCGLCGGGLGGAFGHHCSSGPLENWHRRPRAPRGTSGQMTEPPRKGAQPEIGKWGRRDEALLASRAVERQRDLRKRQSDVPQPNVEITCRVTRLKAGLIPWPKVLASSILMPLGEEEWVFLGKEISAPPPWGNPPGQAGIPPGRELRSAPFHHPPGTSPSDPR